MMNFEHRLSRDGLSEAQARSKEAPNELKDPQKVGPKNGPDFCHYLDRSGEHFFLH